MKASTFFTKKFLYISILLVGVCLAGWWYISQQPENNTPISTNPADKIQVVASGYVPYTLMREIGGEQVDLTMLVPPGTEPHHFEPTPGSIIAVQKADLFVYVSPRIEPWTTDILQGLPQVTAIAAGTTEPDMDPHVWITPYGALAMAKHITEALIKLDPTHKRYYKQNLNRFETQMQQLHADFSAGLQHCQSRDLVHVGHLAFGALADVYGLTLHALSGTSHQGEHSVYKLTNMVQFIRQHKLTAVFTEEMISPQLARTVSEETRVQLLPLYTIEEISKEDFDKSVSYETYMRRNLKNLQEGLQCPA